jgi:hypothetical protein
MGILLSQPIEHVLGRSAPPHSPAAAGLREDPACSVNGDARHLRRPVTRDAQTQKLPRLSGFDVRRLREIAR